jgi:structural maintenance of chromosome 3 (chondroitin sulfate proteoglycan 6)
LTYIESRLEELEEEKEELKEYQEKDRERRCLDYAVYQRELEETTRHLDTVSNFLLCVLKLIPQVEEERANDIHLNNEKQKEFNALDASMKVSYRVLADVTRS